MSIRPTCYEKDRTVAVRHIFSYPNAALKQQAAALGIDFPVLLDDPRQHFNVKPSGVLPETLVIDADGNYRQVLLGPQTEEKLAALLKQLSIESTTEK